MFQQVALFKLADAVADVSTRSAAVSRLRAALAAGGFDGSAGLPADAASEKSWDVSVVVSFRTREQATAFVPSAFFAAESGLASGSVAVAKSWLFEV